MLLIVPVEAELVFISKCAYYLKAITRRLMESAGGVVMESIPSIDPPIQDDLKNSPTTYP